MIQDKLIEIAIREINVSESPAGSNKVKYNTWFYGREVYDGDKTLADGSKSKYPWCGTFVSWVFNEAGIPLGRIDYLKGFAGCQYAVNNVSKWGKIVTIPEKGDVVFYDWDGNGTFEHTAIFEQKLADGLFQAIEGNTAIPKSGDPNEIKKANSNGGIVMRRADRKYKNAIFVRPYALTKNIV